ncbi:hypothetical protein DESA109040_14210 [Deinococcus saxicola]|uniref:toprim domain-containing protein n=1 Tax=Deinococcus saxicola TaxID=249406 RepID=UPI0039F02C09
MKRPGGETGRRTNSIPRLSKPVQQDDTLDKALLHPANSAAELLRWLAGELGTTVEEPLSEHGTVCDIRPGHGERNPSLSYQDTSEGAVFKRHGDDGFGGGAVAFTAQCLNIEKGEAARRLIERAGLHGGEPGTPRTGQTQTAMKPASQRKPAPDIQPLSEAELQRELQGWKPASDQHPEIVRRGLSDALTSGLFQAYQHSQSNDLAFEIRGPNNDTLAVKCRKAGATKGRYLYLTPGRGTPAWCSPDVRTATSELWIEGELNGIAVALALQGSGIGVQGMAGALTQPHLDHLTEKPRDIYIYADPDPAGQKARVDWRKYAVEKGCTVYELAPDVFQNARDALADACDVLGAEGVQALCARLQAAMSASRLDAAEVVIDETLSYRIDGGRFVSIRRRIDRNGKSIKKREFLTTFTAFITHEHFLYDGTHDDKGKPVPIVQFQVKGSNANGKPFSGSRTLTAEEFKAMNWPMDLGGTEATIHAGQTCKDHARACIQMFSTQRGVTRHQVFTHTGWHEQGGQYVYLTADAVIGANGTVDGLTVSLNDRLRNLRLPAPPTGDDETNAVRRSLDVKDLAPPTVHVPSMGALYRSPLGRLGVTVVLVGRTGFLKTAFLSLLMAHYGANFHRDRPPSSWQSSPNALELLAFHAKDVMLLIDDYKPNAGQARQMEESLTRIIQGVADGAGRSTLTGERQVRPNVYPRGTIITSAEEVPAGFSNQARTLLVPITSSLLGENQEHSKRFYEAEDLAANGVFAQAMSGYVQFIAQRYDTLKVDGDVHKKHVRTVSNALRGEHGRTGVAAAELSYGWRCWLSYAVHCGVLDDEAANEQWSSVMQSLASLVGGQQEFHVAQDPVQRFLQILSTLLIQNKVVLEDSETGGTPNNELAIHAGWRLEKSPSPDGELVLHFRQNPNAVKVGWVGESDGRHWAYLLPHAVYSAVQQECQRQQIALPSQTALWSALRDTLHPHGLMRCDTEAKGGQKMLRTTKKTGVFGVDKPIRLLNLAFPLENVIENSGNTGNGGNEEEQSSSETDKNLFPPLSLFQ